MLSSLYEQAQSKNCDICVCDYYEVYDNKKVYKDKTSQKREYPIAVLADGNSASASEILVGAIKESYGGYIVGEKTFGKGTVQQVKKLKDGSMIKYTPTSYENTIAFSFLPENADAPILTTFLSFILSGITMRPDIWPETLIPVTSTEVASKLLKVKL